MVQNKKYFNESIAVFIWSATTLTLIFIAGLLILQPRSHGDEFAGADQLAYEIYEIHVDEEVPEHTIYHAVEPYHEADINEAYSEARKDLPCMDDILPPEPTSPFMAYSFFIPENEEMYAWFHAERPDLDVQTVVWMVNVHLHLPFFDKIFVNEDPNPLLVNSFYRLPAGFVPSNLVRVTHENCNFLATPETAAAFRKLRASASEAGFNITLASAFRPASRQEEIFVDRGARDGRVMRPYHSEHQTGRALDLRGPHGLLDRSGPTPTGAWVAENAHLYGFIIRYRAETTHITGIIHEPWHITYVGLGISMYMNENGILSLEEFVGRNPGVGL